MLTWYDLLGIAPGATAAQVQDAYQARLRQLTPDLLSGATTRVLRAADTARAAADAAWRALSDTAARQRYDEEIGARRTGGGLNAPASEPSGPGGDRYVRGLTGDMVMAGLAELLTAHPGPARRVIVPDLRGLFARSCLRAAGDLGLHVDMVRLTAQPMAVEGLVVGQSPAPGSKVHRDSTVTVQVWHPPRRGS
jgi:curved DNA-binding protein CbpA